MLAHPIPVKHALHALRDDVRAGATLFYEENIHETIARFERVIAAKRKVA